MASAFSEEVTGLLLSLPPSPERDRWLKASSERSLLEILGLLPPETSNRLLSSLTEEEAEILMYDWGFLGRPKQQAPSGDWAVWLLRAGRGFGKTRTAAQWANERAEEYAGRWMALIAKTPADARDILIEGPGGILKCSRPDFYPDYQPSNRRLTWPNGSWATVFSSEEPDGLRGFSGDTAILDEFAKWRNPQLCWDNLAFGMREASTDRPRRLITTTPRPLDILKKIEGLKGTVTVNGSSYENRGNLDPTWYEDTIAPYEGTRLGRQEILGEYVEEVTGAIFTFAAIERVRIEKKDLPELTTIVVAVDPSGAGTEDKDAPEKRPKNDEIGVIVAGLGVDQRVYLLEDLSCNGDPVEMDGVIVSGPAKWGKVVAVAFHVHAADHVVVETNFGGAMASFVIKAADENIPVREITASRAKHVRAEPVAGLYGEKRDGVRHVGTFPRLEDQLTKFTTLGYEGSKSPDRADAWIWAVQDLALSSGAHGWLEFYRRLSVAAGVEIEKSKEVSSQFGYKMAPPAAAIQGPTPSGVPVRVPAGTSQIYGMDGRAYLPNKDRVVYVTEDDAKALLQRPEFERAA